jgi:hypothetical protein
VLAFAAIVILVLASLSIGLYFLADDYHDAKSRAQYVIVDGMITDLNSVADNVTTIAEGTLSDDMRNQSTLTQSVRLQVLERSATELSMMYYKDLDRFVPLSAMGSAFRASAEFLYWLVSGNNWGTANVAAMLTTSACVMELLAQELAKSIDPAKDWAAHPYSLVNRLDLAKIEELSEQLGTP